MHPAKGLYAIHVTGRRVGNDDDGGEEDDLEEERMEENAEEV